MPIQNFIISGLVATDHLWHCHLIRSCRFVHCIPYAKHLICWVLNLSVYIPESKFMINTLVLNERREEKHWVLLIVIEWPCGIFRDFLWLQVLGNNKHFTAHFKCTPLICWFLFRIYVLCKYNKNSTLL